MTYRPKLDPKVDLAGATPETLAKALFRRAEPLYQRHQFLTLWGFPNRF